MRRKPRATTHAALETNYRRRPYWRGAPRVSMVSLDPGDPPRGAKRPRPRTPTIGAARQARRGHDPPHVVDRPAPDRAARRHPECKNPRDLPRRAGARAQRRRGLGSKALAPPRRDARWIRPGERRSPPRARKPIALRTVGANVDLRAIRDAISSHYFAGALPCDITFGRGRAARAATAQRPVRRLRRRREAHPNPSAPRRGLDSQLFVEFVVFHDDCHAAQAPALDASGRCRHHGPRFRELERRFARYDEAIAWERAHIRQLLRSARAVEGPIPRRRGSFDCASERRFDCGSESC